jgi:hypothetical protein
VNKRFREENVEVVVNANPPFVRFYTEEEYVAAPTCTNRIDGEVTLPLEALCYAVESHPTSLLSACTSRYTTSRCQENFTNTTFVNLLTSGRNPPFVVFDGTKTKDAKCPERTLAFQYKYYQTSAPWCR